MGSELTTIKVGGLCREVIEARDELELIQALTDFPDAICIGGGSNLLIPDAGVETALVRSFASEKTDARVVEGVVEVSGTSNWDTLARFCIDHELQGLEATSGIPGSVGGAIVQNAGAYGQEIADVIVNVRAWDRIIRQVVTFNARNAALVIALRYLNTTLHNVT